MELLLRTQRLATGRENSRQHIEMLSFQRQIPRVSPLSRSQKLSDKRLRRELQR